MDDKLVRWLEGKGLGAYAEVFSANDVDLEALRYLDDTDLKGLGVSLGHRRRLLAAIAALDRSGPEQPASRAPTETGDGAERRLLTVMFVDLVGSTSLAGEVDPEDLQELIRQYQVAVTAAVVRYEGYIAKFLGDGVIAYFGWPRAHEDEPERAVRAGFDILAAMRTIGVTGEKTLEARIGIATGEVVVGSIVGEITRDDEAVIGTTPSLADRLQRIAPTAGIVIGPITRQLLGNAFELEDLGEQELKGFGEPVHAWRVLEEISAETRFEAAQAEAIGRLVGREREIEQLRVHWSRAKEGEGQAIVVLGEAGIGKSRLLQEFRREIGSDPRFGFRYQCSPHHANSAFHPIIQQLRHASGISEGDRPVAMLDKIERLFRLSADDLETTVRIIAPLLRVPTSEAFAPLDVPAQQLRQRTIDCLIDQVASLSKRQPMIIAVEDAHWADPSMLDYVNRLMAEIVQMPVLLIVTCRTEHSLEWPALPHLETLTLGRISRHQGAAIARSIGGPKLRDDAVEEIVTRAEGVPLFVEELTKAIVEAGQPNGDEPERIPRTLQTSLVARLDRLGTAKSIAQVGSVIGRDFSHELVAAIAGASAVEVNEALDRLVASGLVQRRGAPPQATYTFKHALIQDAAYATILFRRRKKLHRNIVDLLEAAPSQGPREQIELLAHHAKHAEDWDRAFRYYEQAAQEAIGRSALREAVAQFGHALEAAAKLPDSPDFMRRTIDLRFELRNALWALGRFAEILDHLDDAEVQAKALEDEFRLGWISVYRGASLWQLGRWQDALEFAARGRSVGSSAGHLALEVAGNFYLGCAQVTSGDCRTAETLFEQVIDALPGERAADKCGLPFAPSIISRSWLIWALAERGAFADAEAHAKVAVEQAEMLNLPFNRAHVYYDVGYFHMARGDLEAAVRTLQHGLALIERWGLTYLSPFTVGFLGFAHVKAGEIGRGLSLLEDANRRYERIGLGLFKSLVRVQLAEAYLRAGKLPEATATLESALEIADQRGERGHAAHGFFVKGEIAAQTIGAGPVSAREAYERGIELAEGLGMAPLAARCHLGLGKLLSRSSAEESEAHLATAQRMLAGLGMIEI